MANWTDRTPGKLVVWVSPVDAFLEGLLLDLVDFLLGEVFLVSSGTLSKAFGFLGDVCGCHLLCLRQH